MARRHARLTQNKKRKQNLSLFAAHLFSLFKTSKQAKNMKPKRKTHKNVPKQLKKKKQKTNSN